MVLFYVLFLHTDLSGGLVMFYVSRNTTAQQCVTVCHCYSQQHYC